MSNTLRRTLKNARDPKGCQHRTRMSVTAPAATAGATEQGWSPEWRPNMITEIILPVMNASFLSSMVVTLPTHNLSTQANDLCRRNWSAGPCRELMVVADRAGPDAA